MLREIFCEKFHQKKIEFNPGLSVVLGTDSGENSIGKSTFLLIVDYVFGGSTYSKSTDILGNIGPHDIFFVFVFHGKNYYFCRNSNDPHYVWRCNAQNDKIEKIDLRSYCNWLDAQYSIQLPGLNFRDCVGRYIRVYGKKNCIENQPLHYTPVEPWDDAILAMLKLFNKYATLRDLEARAKASEEALKVYAKAEKHELVAHITKKKYTENEKRLKEITTDIDALSDGLESALIDVDAIQSENAIHIQDLRSYARRMRGRLISKSKLLTENGTYKFSPATHDFSELLEYFPGANIARIEEIEKFHEKIGSIFKLELRREKKKIDEAIAEYEAMIAEYDTQLKELVQNPKISKTLLRRHSDLLKEKERCEKENKSYDKHQRLKQNSDADQESLMNAKRTSLSEMSCAMNKKMSELNDSIYSGSYHAPILDFEDKKYSFHTPDDTGTGIAYKGLIVFDLAVLNLTPLPVLVHDSVILKQISDDAIEQIINLYATCGKQVIIAFDKQTSYTPQTEKILTQNAVLKLSRGGNELFGRSWG